MHVQKIKLDKISAKDIAATFNQNNILFNVVECVNWDEFPYLPEVKFRIAHTGDMMLLHWVVDEQLIKAEVTENNGKVWTDSCVEFFFSLDDGKSYYNLEMNCIGTALLGYREAGKNAKHAGDEFVDSIFRHSSLGNKALDEEPCEEPWELFAAIPAKALFAHQITDFSGLKIKANFYKCGDELSVPHFISWKPINTLEPSFHQPDFFGELELE